MPLIKLEHLADAVAGVWKATESDEFFLRQIPQGYLTGYEPLRFSERRRKEFLASRWMLKSILRDESLSLVMDERGKLKDAGGKFHFSLSHSGNLVAAIASREHVVGIDIEEIHPRILKVMHKFLNEEEKQAIGEPPELWRVILCWSAKESLFKMAETPGLSFSNDMRLRVPGCRQGIIPARIRLQSNWMDVDVFFESTDNYVLTSCAQRF